MNIGCIFFEAVKIVECEGVIEIYVVFSYGFFVEGAVEFFDNINIKEIFVIDLVVIKEKIFKNVCYIIVSELIGDVIVCIYERKLVSLFFVYNKKK